MFLVGFLNLLTKRNTNSFGIEKRKMGSICFSPLPHFTWSVCQYNVHWCVFGKKYPPVPKRVLLQFIFDTIPLFCFVVFFQAWPSISIRMYLLYSERRHCNGKVRSCGYSYALYVSCYTKARISVLKKMLRTISKKCASNPITMLIGWMSKPKE